MENKNLMPLVEEVRSRMNVSYEEARNALLQSEEDVLEAVIFLEREKAKRKEDAKAYSKEALKNLKDTELSHVVFYRKEKEVEVPLMVAGIATLLGLRRPKLFGMALLVATAAGGNMRIRWKGKEIPVTEKLRGQLETLANETAAKKPMVLKQAKKMKERILHGGKEEDDHLEGYFSADLDH